MNGSIPLAPEIVDGAHVPPIEEEVSMRKVSQLGQTVGEPDQKSREHRVMHDRSADADSDCDQGDIKDRVLAVGD